MVDLGYRGSGFTWCRGKDPTSFIRERLDRFLASPQWVSLFPHAEVRHLPIYKSDLAPILPNSERRSMDNINEKLFPFESFWLSNENCEKVFADAWKDFGGSPIESHLEHCANSLNEWASKSFGDVKRLIKTTEKKLSKAHKLPPDAHMIFICNTLAAELDDLHNCEEAYWHMRSRVNELRDGDSNTKYFHHKANSRRKRNLIRGLENTNGTFLTSKSDIERLITGYFDNIFATSSPYGIPEALEGIERLVTAEMNSVLDEEPSHDEILFQMHPTKAPSIDGFHALFFQKFWHIIGDDIVGLVKNWWRGNIDLSVINKHV